MNTNGMVVFKKDISTVSGNISIYLPGISSGLYIVELAGDGILQTERILVR
jgi:hypothetical protein